MSRLNDANDSYAAFKNASVSLHVVRHKLVEEVWRSCETVRQSLRESGVDQDASDDAKRVFYRLRRILTSTPLSFDSRYLPVSAIADELNNFLPSPNYASINPAIKHALNTCGQLLAEPLNPISTTLLEVLDEGATVVLMDPSFVTPVNNWIQANSDLSTVSVVTRSEVQSLEFVHKLVYLGSPFYTAYRIFSEPDWRFLRDPRATELHFIMYPFGESDIKVYGIAEKDRLMRSVISTARFLSVDNQEDDLEVNEWAIIEAKESKSQVANEDETIPARFVGLAGNYFMYLEDYPDAKVLSVFTDNDNLRDVGNLPLKDLSPGDSILVRTEGASADLIQAYADELGAGQIRFHQDQWKEALQNGIAARGGLHKFRKLIDGKLQVDSLNIRNWAYNPRLIAPHFQSDFNLLCESLERPELKSSWNYLDTIRKFHQEAGRDIVKLLRERIKDIPADNPEFLENGFVEVRDESLGGVGVYKVQHVGKPQPVNPGMIGRLLRQP